MGKVWFVTGSSRGLGREFVKAALSRGDRVAATARNTDVLVDLRTAYGEALLLLSLDVTDKAAVHETVQRACDHFGRLDVVVNNAGTIVHGAVEELSEQNLRAQLETNLFGPVWVTQAALPHLRRQGSGRIIQMSSLGGIIAHPTLGAYQASKWALEGITEALAGEVAQFGIHVTIVEPGAYRTGMDSSAVHAKPLPHYDLLRASLQAGHSEHQYGEPAAAAQALLKIVDADNPPLRVIFGTQPHQLAQQAYADRLAGWQEWAGLSAEAQGTQT